MMKKILLWLCVFAWMVGIWYVSDQPDVHSGLKQDLLLRKLAHVFEFAVLTWLLLLAIRGRYTRDKDIITAVAVAVVYAFLDEWHQTWIAGRHGVINDVLIDSIGCLIVGGVAWWKRIRSPAGRVA